MLESLALALLLVPQNNPPTPTDSSITAAQIVDIKLQPTCGKPSRFVELSVRLRGNDKDALPDHFTIAISGQPVEVWDNGVFPDGEAKDHVFTAAGVVADGGSLSEAVTIEAENFLAGDPAATIFLTGNTQQMDSRYQLPVAMTSSARLADVGPTVTVSCHFERVSCPDNCRSIIFRTKCVICLELKGCDVKIQWG